MVMGAALLRPRRRCDGAAGGIRRGIASSSVFAVLARYSVFNTAALQLSLAGVSVSGIVLPVHIRMHILINTNHMCGSRRSSVGPVGRCRRGPGVGWSGRGQAGEGGRVLLTSSAVRDGESACAIYSTQWHTVCETVMSLPITCHGNS